MPIYGYRCRSCGHEFEVLQKMSDAPLKTCPKCSGQLAKIVYPAGVVYKGSGYYSTDYKAAKTASAASSNGAKSDSDSSSSSDTKPAGESSSKSETKPESKASESSSSE
jgi:putative FmdB family regulatory protein